MPSEPIPPRILGLALLLQALIKLRTEPPVDRPASKHDNDIVLNRPRETELEMAERHVALGEKHIARQRQIVADMTERGQLSNNALDLLQTFEEMQRNHVAHRKRLRGY